MFIIPLVTCKEAVLSGSCFPFLGGQYSSTTAYYDGTPDSPSALTGATWYIEPDGHTIRVLRDIGTPLFTEYLSFLFLLYLLFLFLFRLVLG